MNTRRTLLIVVVTSILLMTAGYAAMAQILTITGTTNVNDVSWDIKFTEIKELNMTGATSVNTPSVSGTTATFEVNLEYPGATAVYQITVANQGTINAILDDITGLEATNSSEPLDLQYTVSEILNNDTLNAGETKSFKITVTWVSSSEAVPTISKTATIGLNYIQNTG